MTNLEKLIVLYTNDNRMIGLTFSGDVSPGVRLYATREFIIRSSKRINNLKGVNGADELLSAERELSRRLKSHLPALRIKAQGR
jgi:hypothetical protein